MPRVALRARLAPSAFGGGITATSTNRFRQRRIYAIAHQAAHAGGVLALPVGIDGKWHIRRPARHGAARKLHRVANRFVAATAAIEHPRQHRHVEISVVVDAHFALAVIEAMQPDPRIARSFLATRRAASEIRCRVGRHQNPRPHTGRWPRSREPPPQEWQPSELEIASSSFLRIPPRSTTRCCTSRANCLVKESKMFIPLGQHQRRPSLPKGLDHVLADKSIALLIGNQFLIEFVEL